MKSSYKFYRGCFRLANPVIRFFRPFEVIGMENICKGAAVVCANHSAMIDPFLIALVFGIESHMHVLAKIELFKIPVIKQILEKLGMIRVNRGIIDVASIKSSLGYLKKGEKVVIFPEGTRVTEDESVEAKNGAVKLAERAGIPVIPFFIPRKKPFFKKVRLIVGKPYLIEKLRNRRSVEEYVKLSEDLMNRIHSLDSKGLV